MFKQPPGHFHVAELDRHVKQRYTAGRGGRTGIRRGLLDPVVRRKDLLRAEQLREHVRIVFQLLRETGPVPEMQRHGRRVRQRYSRLLQDAQALGLVPGPPFIRRQDHPGVVRQERTTRRSQTAHHRRCQRHAGIVDHPVWHTGRRGRRRVGVRAAFEQQFDGREVSIKARRGPQRLFLSFVYIRPGIDQGLHDPGFAEKGGIGQGPVTVVPAPLNPVPFPVY